MVISTAQIDSTPSAGPRAEPLLITVGGVTGAPEALLRFEHLQAIDRPCVLELELAPPSPGNAPRFSTGERAALTPDAPLRVSLAGDEVFRGVVERVAFEERAGASRVVVTACETYHFLRESLAGVAYRRVTLEELAWDVAVRLGLKPRVALDGESAGRVLEVVHIGEDPLATLRELANERGLHLGVWAGVLSLGAWPRAPRSIVVTPRDGLELLRVETCRGGAAEARLAFPRRHAARPLDAVTLRGFGTLRDGEFRVRRARARLSSPGWRTELELQSPEGEGRRRTR